MKTSQAGLDFIQANEGCVLHVYNDVAGKPTIGVGHLLQSGESYPDGVTEAQAMGLLAADVGIVENHLQVYLPSDCTQNQFDALIDFGFNLGCGALETMLGHGWDQVPTQILRWDKAGGQVVPGLAARRQRELILFQTAD